jgi:hypothetical protein
MEFAPFTRLAQERTLSDFLPEGSTRANAAGSTADGIARTGRMGRAGIRALHDAAMTGVAKS